MVGCGPVDNARLIAEAQGLNCAGERFVAFGEADVAEPAARVAVQGQVMAEAKVALDDPARAAESFARIDALYRETVGLRAEVRGMTDEAYPENPIARDVGERIDVAITVAIANGRLATSVTAVDTILVETFVNDAGVITEAADEGIILQIEVAL